MSLSIWVHGMSMLIAMKTDEPQQSIEAIIRRIVREEIERGLAGSELHPFANNSKRLFSVLEVAQVVGASAQYIRNDIRSGQLTASRLGKTKYVVDRDEVERYARRLQERGRL
jgi:excisionase family DNA binding protein